MCGKPWVRDRYTPYAEGFTTAVATLAHLRRKRKGFSELLHKCTMSESLDGLALDDLLIMPIQRIPRYAMLLDELSKHTSTTDVEYAKVHHAATALRAIALELNEKKRGAENLANVVAIQHSITGSFRHPIQHSMSGSHT